jgi:vacuolar protein sorting-associated protein 35
MKKLGLSIINNLINPNSKEKINSIEKLDQLFLFIRPLLKNIISTEEENDVNFEKEQNTVAKLIFVIRTKDPEILYDIYTKLRYTLYEGGKKRLIITYPALANALIHICQQLTFSYENKDKEVEEDENTIDLYDISKFESDDLFYEFLSKVYDFLSDIINTIGEIIPQLGIKLNLLALSQVNNVNVKAIREKLEEKSLLFFNNCMNLYKAYDKEKRFDLFIDICQKLLEIDIISKEKLESIFKELFSEAKSMPKRTDQCNGLLIMSQLYYKHFKDSKKIVECLKAAKRVADFSLTNPHNLILYVLLLNKYIYYVDVDEENIAEIKSEQIEDLVEAIKNHIITIKTDKNIDASFLPEIENYFKNTVALIELRKKAEKHKEIYDSINITSS